VSWWYRGTVSVGGEALWVKKWAANEVTKWPTRSLYVTQGNRATLHYYSQNCFHRKDINSRHKLHARLLCVWWASCYTCMLDIVVACLDNGWPSIG